MKCDYLKIIIPETSHKSSKSSETYVFENYYVAGNFQ